MPSIANAFRGLFTDIGRSVGGVEEFRNGIRIQGDAATSPRT